MNPPYKPVGTGIESLSEADKIARHETMCTIDDAVAAAAKLLKFGGRFCMCHRPERLCDIIVSMRAGGVEVKRIRFVVEREGEKLELNGIKFQTMTAEDGRLTIIYDFIIRGVEPNFLNVAKNSVLESVSIGRMVWISLLDLVTGQYGLSELSGPIGTVTFIAEAAQTATQQTDYSYLFTLLALIAINIGLFNLLPLPALDGGRLFFLAIEFVFRKPVPAKYEGWVHAIGMVLLLVLMAVISFSDILRLIRG
jgi:regulator of sigma E protease